MDTIAENLCDLCEYHPAEIKLVSVDGRDEYFAYCKKCFKIISSENLAGIVCDIGI